MRRPLVGGRQPPSPAHQYSGVQNRGNDNMIEATILSVRKAAFKGKDGDPNKTMWNIFCADSTGAVGTEYIPPKNAP